MFLDRVLEATRARVGTLPETFPRRFVESPRSLTKAIRSVKGKNAVIAEIKYASPSSGPLTQSVSPGHLASSVIEASCTGLSILTEPTYFGGSTAILEQVRTISPVPILRKDFIIDERQVYETRAIGADAILLIAGILKDKLPSFVHLSLSLGLEPLVEVHTLRDAHNALRSDATLIGINNRNLETLKIDLGVTPRLYPCFAGNNTTVISMSGIQTPEDIRRLKGYCHAFLIGTAIMRSPHPATTLEGFVFA